MPLTIVIRVIPASRVVRLAAVRDGPGPDTAVASAAPAVARVRLGHVGDLNPGDVLSVGLAPIPWAPAAGPDFHVLTLPEATHFHHSPGEVFDSRRIGGGHAASF